MGRRTAASWLLFGSAIPNIDKYLIPDCFADYFSFYFAELGSYSREKRSREEDLDWLRNFCAYQKAWVNSWYLTGK